MLIRFILGWIWTLLCSIAAFVLAITGQPRRAWLWLRRPWGRITLWLVGVRMDVRGLEHLRGPAVFVSNHVSLLDVIVLPALVPKESAIVAKKEISRVPFLGWALRRIGGIMIDRKNARAAIASMRAAVAALPSGWSVTVFPEGTRSPDGRLQPFKKGAFHIAMQAGLPIVPVGVGGTDKLMPKGEWMPRHGRMAVTVGPPISIEGWTREGLSAHVEEVHAAVGRCVDASRKRLEADERERERARARLGMAALRGWFADQRERWRHH